jgi:predicted ester cyclase
MRLRRRHRSGEASAQPAGADEAAGSIQSTGEPFPGYDSTDERELVDQLFRHSQAELEAIEAYERSHGSRTRVLNKLHYLRQHEPWPGYDGMSSEQVAVALQEEDLATIKGVRAYERKFANRPPVLDAVEAARLKRVAEEPAHDTPDYHATSYGPSVSATSSRAPGPGHLAANKALVTRFYAEAINGRDLEAVDQLLSDSFVHNGERRGRSGQRQAIAEFLDAFPDLRHEIELLVAEGDLVAAHQRWTGTQDGRIAGLDPTGRRVEFTSTAVLRIRDGLIAEAWDEVDLAGLMSQLSSS